MKGPFFQHGSWMIAAMASVVVHALALVGMTRVVIEPATGQSAGNFAPRSSMNTAGAARTWPSRESEATPPQRTQPPAPLPPQTPEPEPPKPETPLSLGIERSEHETETWLGFETPTEHGGLKSDQDQAQLAIETGGGTFASGSPGAPIVQEGAPAAAAQASVELMSPSDAQPPSAETASPPNPDEARAEALPLGENADAAQPALLESLGTPPIDGADVQGTPSEFPSPQMPEEERPPAREVATPTQGLPEGEARGLDPDSPEKPLVPADPREVTGQEPVDPASSRPAADEGATQALLAPTPEALRSLPPDDQASDVPILPDPSPLERTEPAPRATREVELAAPALPMIGLPEGVMPEEMEKPSAQPEAGPMGPPPPPGRDAVSVPGLAGESPEVVQTEPGTEGASPGELQPAQPGEAGAVRGASSPEASPGASPTSAGSVQPGAPGEPRAGLSPRAGERADRESDATARKPILNVRPGRPAAAQGLRINTIRPRWGVTTRILSAPSDPVVKISFDRKGVVRSVEFVDGQDAGSPDLNGPLLEAIYRWTARGEALEKLPRDSDRARVTLTMRIVLGGN